MEDTKILDENVSADSYWNAVTASTDGHPSPMDQTTIALLKFAKPLLTKAKFTSLDGTEHSAFYYAMVLYITADELINTTRNPVLTNHVAQGALMLTLQECVYCDSNWSYGSRILFDLKHAKLNIPRPAIAAFLAQEGTWGSNRSKSDLLDGNLAAVGLYCARLKVLCQIFLNKKANLGGTEEALEKIEVQQELKTPQEILGFYLNEFAVPYLTAVGAENAQMQVDAFQKYLAQQSDFYAAPCSTKYHLNRDGGLAEHTIHVLMQMLWLTLPATKQQLGACVLAAIGHDLCKIGVYLKQFKSKKVYISADDQVPEAAFVKQDGGGQFYWADDFYYEFKDKMPFGHGRKSAYMLLSFFPQIHADLYAAVDAHMGDHSSNPRFMELFAENSLALNLHIADVLATNIDEHGA